MFMISLVKQARNLQKDGMREPTQERGRKRVEAILAAAAQIVARSGVHAVTTTDVAKTAQVPVGSVYQFFEGAPDILQTLQWRMGAEIVAECRAAVDAMPDGEDWRDVNRRSFNTYWDGLLARPVYIALQREATVTQSLSQSMSTGESDIGELLRYCLAKGGVTLPPAREDAIIETVLGALSALTDLALLLDDVTARDLRRREMEHMTELYLADALEG